jgi:hypothetical protein
MSTGLTYLNIIDEVAGAPDTEFGPIMFNSYEDAYAWGEWYQRFRIAYSYPAVVVTIFTSSPSQNGFWYPSGGVVSFIPFD